MTEIIARVVSQKGTCDAGHKVGDEFVFGQTLPAGLCSWAFGGLFPLAEILDFGGTLPWETDPDRAMCACPDPANPVVFELRRIREDT